MSSISKLPGIKQDIELRNHTTFRIGGAAKYFFVASRQADFKKAVAAAKEAKLPFWFLGGGSNTLVSDGGFEGLVIKTDNKETKTEKEGETLKVVCEAGASFNRIILDSVKAGYSGVEWGFGIPGAIGGAVFGNAGRLGEDISKAVESVKVLDENLNEKTFSKNECNFDYRESRFKKTGEIILETTLVLKKKKAEELEAVFAEAKKVIVNSPRFPSAGCAFKNYKTAGENDPLLQNHPELIERVRGGKIGVGFLIDQCGLKGKKVGGAQVWEGHANYIVNTGGATAREVKTLIDNVVEAMGEKYGIVLEPEIRFLGF